MKFEDEFSKVLPFPYEYLLHIEEFDFTSQSRVINLIFKFEENYLILTDFFDKVMDVDMMPDYIKKDWLRNNSRDITLLDVKRIKGIINHILCLDDDAREPDERVYKVFRKHLDNIKIIERDLKIKGLLS